MSEARGPAGGERNPPAPDPGRGRGSEPSEATSDVRRVSSGGPWEEEVGYSRAVAAGPYAFVSGCTAVVDRKVQHDGDPYEQTLAAFGVAGRALEELGLGLADVVQTRMYLVHSRDAEAVGRAHKKLFGDTRPAATMVSVGGLIDTMMLVEVEVVAYRGTGS
jgi:enamine deaminase RidA (YjgF/YER057c/UK114 family)